MKLAVLNQLQEAGALKVQNLSNGIFKVGTVNIVEEQCKVMAMKLSWTRFELPGHRIISKTDQFISGIMKYIDKPVIIENTEVTFTNARKLDTEKYFDRIKLVCPDLFDITVLYAMPGVKGKYGVYTSKDNFAVQAQAFRSLKELGTWINNLV